MCVVLPYAQDVASLLEGFRLLNQYTPGSQVIERRAATGQPEVAYKLRCKLQVWYDCPQVHPRSKALRMQFGGKVAEQPESEGPHLD